MAVQQGVPVPNQPLLEESGLVTAAWRQFFVSLWQRTGGGSGGGGAAVSLTASSTCTGLVQAYSDADAQTKGVPLHGFYWNGSVLQVRQT